jgi:hypothetical protein
MAFQPSEQGDRSILNKFVSKMYICTGVNPNESYHAEANMSLIIIVNEQTSNLVMVHKESHAS